MHLGDEAKPMSDIAVDLGDEVKHVPEIDVDLDDEVKPAVEIIAEFVPTKIPDDDVSQWWPAMVTPMVSPSSRQLVPLQ